jgi:hypothetical protein
VVKVFLHEEFICTCGREYMMSKDAISINRVILCCSEFGRNDFSHFTKKVSTSETYWCVIVGKHVTRSTGNVTDGCIWSSN